MTSTPDILSEIVDSLREGKARRITALDLSALDGVAYERYVIAEGDSTTHVSSIADKLKHKMRHTYRRRLLASDGEENAQWIVADYGDALVHVFLRSAREFYSLETLWADAAIVEYPDEL